MTILSTSEQQYDVQSTDTSVLIPRGVLLGGTNGVYCTYSHIDVVNYGDIYAPSDGISMQSGTDSAAHVFNAAGASITTSGAGIFIAENRDFVLNSGSIDATTGILLSATTGSFVSNSGVINGVYSGIVASSTTDTYLINTGRISGQNYGFFYENSQSNKASRFENSGLVKGGRFSFAVTGYASGTLALRNSGTLDGFVSTGPLITNAVNSGTINGSLIMMSGQDSLRNYGTINGSVYLSGTTPGTTQAIYNRGAIAGDLSLGDGVGTIFDGRKGSVDGTIFGGSGVDTITAGNDGEIISGGGGNDLITGGLGADTFMITSITTGDTIHKFGVANDTIELSKSGFSRLTVGDSPTFAIASAATSPTDYLFYNSSTGVLFYDVDGSGARNPYAIATLDKGLQLTASNFSVV